VIWLIRFPRWQFYTTACRDATVLPVSLEDGASPPDPLANDPELDGLRIRQLSTMRRAAYRSRSHAVVAMLVCVVAVVQAAIDLIGDVRHAAIGWRIPVYLAFIVAGTVGAIFFARRASALHREAKATRLQPPATPPDFSTLGDGSQRWPNLEDIHD
jgi:hypothetical protein